MPSLEHIGIAVDDVATVIDNVRTLLGSVPYKAETVPEQQVRTHFIDAGTAKLELLESLADDSPVQNFLDRRGEGLNHLAFEVNDAEAAMARLRDAGFTLLSDAPQTGADDKRIFFVHPKETHGVLIEFCETVAPSWSPTLAPHREGRLAVYERGDRDRPSLLVLHGAAGSTLLESAPLMRRLEPHFHLIGVDLSGHGGSSLPPDDAFTIDRLANDARAALDAVDASTAHLFGFSMGASVALRLAHTHPDRVRRLALLGASAAWTAPLARAMQARLDLDTLRRRDPERTAPFEAQHQHPDRLFAALRAFVDTLPDKTDEMHRTLAAVDHSTLVVALDEDPLFSLDDMLDVHARLANAHLAVLPGTRHRLAAAPLAALTPLLRDHFSVESEAPSPNL
jgi:methylmalonyl-CoA epimerase